MGDTTSFLGGIYLILHTSHIVVDELGIQVLIALNRESITYKYWFIPILNISCTCTTSCNSDSLTSSIRLVAIKCRLPAPRDNRDITFLHYSFCCRCAPLHQGCLPQGLPLHTIRAVLLYQFFQLAHNQSFIPILQLSGLSLPSTYSPSPQSLSALHSASQYQPSPSCPPAQHRWRQTGCSLPLQ